MPDLISIIMPVYNAENFLQECLESIKQQSHTNWELIAVDDFSTDASFKVLEEASSFDNRIRVLKNTEKGIIPALSLALKSADGSFITRMDSDDIMPPDRLSTMLEASRAAPPKTLVSGLVKYFSKDEVSDGYQIYEHWLNANILTENPWKSVYRECIIASPCWMCKTEELKHMGGFENLEYPEDYDLVFQWYKNNFTVKAINQTLLLWREHPARTSRNSENYAQAAFFNLKVKRFIENEIKEEQTVLWGSSIKARLTARILLERNIEFLWMDLHPEKYPDGIFGKEILHFKHLEKLSKAKLILTVYPPPEEMRKMETYLHKFGYAEGENYWYF